MFRLFLISGSTAALLVLQYVGQLMRISVASLISAAIIIGVVVYNYSRRPTRLPNTSTNKERTRRRVLFALVGFATYKILFDAFDTYQFDRLIGLINFVKDLTQFGIIVLILTSFRKDELAETLSALGLGIALYAGINLIAFRLGVVPQQFVTQSFAALSSGLSERIVVPFGPGLNSFGTMSACGFLFCLFGGKEFLTKKQYIRALATIIGSLVCLYAIYRVEMRAGLISVIFGLVWLCLRSDATKRLVVMGTVFGSVAFPIVATTPVFVPMIELLIPGFVFENFQRSTEDFATLGGRVDVWRYAYDLTTTGKTGWLGQGLNARDSSPVLEASTVESFGSVALSFHNGFVELLVVYGPLIGLLGSLLLIYACWITTGFWSTDAGAGHILPRRSAPMDSCIGLSCCLLLANLFEAFSATAFFWSVLLLIYGIFNLAGADSIHSPAARPTAAKTLD